MIALRVASTTATLQAGVFASGTIATSASMIVRMADAPLQRLHAAHRRADHGDDVVDAEFFLQEAILRFHHVAHGEFRKAHAPCAFELLGEVVSPLPIASVQMMKYLSGSSALPGPIMKSMR